jgi:hypothetical protein
MSGQLRWRAATVAVALAALIVESGAATPTIAQPPGLTLLVAAHHQELRLLGVDATDELTFLRYDGAVPLLETKRPGTDPTVVASLPADRPVRYSAGHVVLLMPAGVNTRERDLTVYDVDTGATTAYSYLGDVEHLLALAGGALVMEHPKDRTVWLWPAPDAPEVKLGQLDQLHSAVPDANPGLAAADDHGVVVTDRQTTYYFDFADPANDATFAAPRGHTVYQVWLSADAIAFTDDAGDYGQQFRLLRVERGSATETVAATAAEQFWFASMSATGTVYELAYAPDATRATGTFFVTTADGGTQEMGVCTCLNAVGAAAGGWYVGTRRDGQTEAVAPGIWHVDDDAITAIPDPLPHAFLDYGRSYYSPTAKADYVPADFTMTPSARPVADTFSCWVDDNAEAACPQPVAVHESDGPHALHVFGSNDSGDGPIETYPVVVDGTPPSASMTRPGSWTLADALPVAWSGTDGGSGVVSYDVRYQAAAGTNGFGSYRAPSSWQHTAATSASLGGVRGTEYCFSARATDGVGNVGAWSAPRCTAIPYDDRALTAATRGWSRQSANGYFERTYTQSATHGATLTHAAVTADMLAVVATHCSTCGALSISIGGHVVAKIDLHASSTTRSLTSVSFPRISGTVSIRVVSATGKLVRIDAVGFRRA